MVTALGAVGAAISPINSTVLLIVIMGAAGYHCGVPAPSPLVAPVLFHKLPEDMKPEAIVVVNS